MKTSDFYYDLPENLIAQTPVYPRDSSRLLVYERANKEIRHNKFFSLPDYLKAGDVLVINNTRVLPARLKGIKESGAVVEILLLKRLNYTDWECLCRPGKKMRTGDKVMFSSEISAEVIGIGAEGVRVLRFIWQGVFENVLERVGVMPLPPYIKEKLEDGERYQTVYSLVNGSAAAPTAGLHFTEDLLSRIKEKGVEIIEVLLHVGLGTFRPVKVDDVEAHVMHSEYYEVTDAGADAVNRAKREGRRIIAVGTTSVRVLESVRRGNEIVSGSGETKIFLYPPKKIMVADALITNFHLPESTLLMLVSCMTGTDELMRIYRNAVEEKYRFFSFGDAMFIM